MFKPTQEPERIEVRAWSDPKPRSVWRYTLVVVATVLAGWWMWRREFGGVTDFWWGFRIWIVFGATSAAFLVADKIFGRPFRS